MRTKKTLTEQVESYFKYRNSSAWHKQKMTPNKDSLWRPPKRRVVTTKIVKRSVKDE